MTWQIIKFELRYHLRQPLFYILFVIFFFMAFGGITSDGVTIGGPLGNVHRNAPFVIMQFLLVFSIFGVITSTAYVASSIHRDVEYNTESLFYSTPVKKWQYLTGRFAAAWMASSLVYVGVVLAIMAGSKMWWLDKEQLGPFMLKPYVFSYFVLIVPSLLLFGAIFFSIAALTRSLLTTYCAVAAFYVGYVVSRVMLSNLDSEKAATLTDPFGFAAFARTTRYWTVYEKNTRILPIEGWFLWNRLLWLGLAFAVLAFTFARFRMETGGARASKKQRREAAPLPLGPSTTAVPRVRQRFDFRTALQQFTTTLRIEISATLKSLPYIIILLLAVLNTLAGAVFAGRIFGTTVYPVTREMVSAIDGGFVFFAIIIAAFYAGEIVWRERMLKLSDVVDAMPAPTWAMWAGKLAALILTTYCTLFPATLTTIGVQLFKHYYHLELREYFIGVFLINGSQLVLIAVLMFFAQILVNNRYVGFMVALLYILTYNVLDALHFEHKLYQLFHAPEVTYSDMNGYGHFARPFTWFTVYWLIFAAILVVIGHLFWMRGTETAMRLRMRIARHRFGRPAFASLALLFIAFATTGCYIFYNTNVLNHYVTGDVREKRSAEYEKQYKQYERIPQPRITDVQADVAIYPEKRWVDISGRYTLLNKTQQPIRDVHVVMSPDVTSATVTIPGSKTVTDDRVHGYAIYRLAQPLAPGAALPMTFRVAVHHEGFENSVRDNTIVENGTFINNEDLFPHIGYIHEGELQEASKRRKYGLPPVVRMPKIDDAWARGNILVSHEADWINLDTTVSTSPDQIAIAPGYLQREWTENGRRYFRYKTTSPILPFWSYLSARYTVKRGQWHGIPIEIYYDAQHPYNVDRMIYAVQKTLDYCTANFSPYQHRQVRIIEFPRYQQFAQSFPNTIPFSEGIGFIADLRDKEDIDYVFYVTAHEVAHQWWAHQVIGADVQGATLLDETLAQYTAMMVMEHEYGPKQMRRYLKYELDRYLAGRGGELVAEMPLALVENQQYIHYRKGSLVMYELKDQLGEDKVNAALRKLIHDHAFEQAPYVTTRDLIADFRAVAPPDKQQLITDLFERITLYDNRATQATYTQRADGKYVVTVTVQSRKLRGDGTGAESPVPVDDWIDIGVLGDAKKKGNEPVLALESHRITGDKETFSMVVGTKPARAGIDPLNKLVDRNPDDNTIAVSKG